MSQDDQPLITEDGETIEAEFIAALDDAQLRLNCFSLVARKDVEFNVQLECARKLYNWIMDDEEGPAELDPTATTEDQCDRRH